MKGAGLKFTKMSAGGYDFIMVDGVTAADEPFAIDPDFVRRACSRALSVGADGLILIEPAQSASVTMTYDNADGGRAALCGNGVHCVARMVAVRRWAPPEAMTIQTDAGMLPAGVEGEMSRFSLALGRPALSARTLVLEGSLDEVAREVTGTHVVAGVPHLVVEARDAHGMDRDRFLSLASRLRRHPDLGPEGANVDYVTVRGRDAIDIRFFERGVEGETLTSGTGCIASALTVHRSGKTDATVVCRSRSGVTSTVALSEDPNGGAVATLSGHARIIYTAVMNDEALQGFTPAESGA